MSAKENFYSQLHDARSREPRSPAEEKERERLELELGIRNLKSALEGLATSYGDYYRSLYGFGVDIHSEAKRDLSWTEQFGKAIGTGKAKLREMRVRYHSLEEELEKAEAAMRSLQQQIAVLREGTYRTMNTIGIETLHDARPSPRPSRK